MVNGRIAALDTDSETCKVKVSRMEKVTLIVRQTDIQGQNRKWGVLAGTLTGKL